VRESRGADVGDRQFRWARGHESRSSDRPISGGGMRHPGSTRGSTACSRRLGLEIVRSSLRATSRRPSPPTGMRRPGGRQPIGQHGAAQGVDPLSDDRGRARRGRSRRWKSAATSPTMRVGRPLSQESGSSSNSNEGLSWRTNPSKTTD
jgi:hypothetical protein